MANKLSTVDACQMWMRLEKNVDRAIARDVVGVMVSSGEKGLFSIMGARIRPGYAAW